MRKQSILKNRMAYLKEIQKPNPEESHMELLKKKTYGTQVEIPHRTRSEIIERSPGRIPE